MSSFGVAHHLANAELARRNGEEALKEFIAALERRDWIGAESWRLKAVTALESQLDHLASAHRRLDTSS